VADDALIGVLLRDRRAAHEGSARVNLRLLARAICGGVVHTPNYKVRHRLIILLAIPQSTYGRALGCTTKLQVLCRQPKVRADAVTTYRVFVVNAMA
jgi:hypothetical protein